MRPCLRVTSPIAAATAVCLVASCAGTPPPTRLDAAVHSAAAASTPRTVTIDVSLVAAIVQSPSTIGISDASLYNLSAGDLERQLALLQEAGVTDLRVGVPWVYIQPTAQTYDWSKMDALVTAANEMGFSVTAAITGNTAWGGGVPLAGAPDPVAYAAFAGATAARYKGKISAYEVWNEPNGVIFYAPVNPESYTKVLQAAYSAIKANDDEAIVVGGVLGATRTIPGVSMAPDEFLERMYAAGAQGSFDALSYHPYHYTLPFSQGGDVADSPMNQVLALRALMEANGDGTLKLWATEYGTPTTPFFGLSEAQQSAFMQDFIAAWQNVEGAGPAFLYSARDVSTGVWDNEANFGLFKSNWAPKEFVPVLTDIQQQLDDGTFDTTFTASKVPFAQEMFIQLASLGLGLTNTALIIPRAIGQGLYGLVQQAVTALVDAVKSLVSPSGAGELSSQGRAAGHVPDVVATATGDAKTKASVLSLRPEAEDISSTAMAGERKSLVHAGEVRMQEFRLSEKQEAPVTDTALTDTATPGLQPGKLRRDAKKAERQEARRSAVTTLPPAGRSPDPATTEAPLSQHSPADRGQDSSVVDSRPPTGATAAAS